MPAVDSPVAHERALSASPACALQEPPHGKRGRYGRAGGSLVGITWCGVEVDGLDGTSLVDACS